MAGASGNATTSDKTNRPFHCDECTNTYTRQEHLDRHVSGVHRASKDFVCAQCSKGFSRRDILRRHEQAHMKTGKPGEVKSTKSTVGKGKGVKKRTAKEPDEEDVEPPMKILRTTKRQLAAKPTPAVSSEEGSVASSGEDEDDEDDQDEYDPDDEQMAVVKIIVERGGGGSASRGGAAPPGSEDEWNRTTTIGNPQNNNQNHQQQQQQHSTQQQSVYSNNNTRSAASPNHYSDPQLFYSEYSTQPPNYRPPNFATSSPYPHSPLSMAPVSGWDTAAQPPAAKSGFDFLGLVASASYLSDADAPTGSRHLPTVPDASLRLNLSDPNLHSAPLSFYNHLPPHSSLHRLHDSAADTLLSLSAPRTPPRSSPELEDIARVSAMSREATTNHWSGGNHQTNVNASRALSSSSSQFHMPRVTIKTREQLVSTIASLGMHGAIIPDVELLDIFMTTYFERYHLLFPMIHAPTFNPQDAPPFLLLAMASIGARYSYRVVELSAQHSTSLLEITRTMLMVIEELDPSVTLTLAWQQALIFVLLSGLCSGGKRALEQTHSFSIMPSSACRRQGWLRSHGGVDLAAEASYSLDERWKRWRDREATLRLGFGAMFFEGMGCTLWGMESSLLFVDAADTPLPCRDRLWEATSAIAWQSLFNGTLPETGLTTRSALVLITDVTQHQSHLLQSLAEDVYAMATLLTILNVLAWNNNRELHLKATFFPANSVTTASGALVQHSVNVGFDYFKDKVVLPPEVQALLILDTKITQSSMSLMLNLSAMTSRLPLRILQPLIRTATFDHSTVTALQTWSLEESGRKARTTLYHAAQLYALVRIGTFPQDSPLDPMCVFYAALTMLCYIRQGPRSSLSSFNGGGGEQGRPTIELDRLIDRSDPRLLAFLQDGRAIPCLDQIGSLASPGASAAVVRECRALLAKLKVWSVGESLAETLAGIGERLEI